MTSESKLGELLRQHLIVSIKHLHPCVQCVLLISTYIVHFMNHGLERPLITINGGQGSIIVAHNAQLLAPPCTTVSLHKGAPLIPTRNMAITLAKCTVEMRRLNT